MEMRHRCIADDVEVSSLILAYHYRHTSRPDCRAEMWIDHGTFASRTIGILTVIALGIWIAMLAKGGDNHAQITCCGDQA